MQMMGGQHMPPALETGASLANRISEPIFAEREK